MNLEEWNDRIGVIKRFCLDVLHDISMTGLGSLLQRVKKDEWLEPVFRHSNKWVQGTKIMDVHASIVDNLNWLAELHRLASRHRPCRAPFASSKHS